MRNQMSASKKAGYLLMALPGLALEGLIAVAAKLGLSSRVQKEPPSARQQPSRPPDEHNRRHG